VPGMRRTRRSAGLPHATSGSRARTATLLILFAGAAGCSITGTSARDGQQLELARNRQRWASAGLHDYEFDFQRNCFCAPEATERVHILVRRDAIVSVVRSRDGQPASATFAVWPRVDELFTDVQQRVDQHVERLDVRYDPTFGYPLSVVVDIAALAADDEYSLTAGNLRRLP
jgi:hypothetical protein